MLGLKNIFEKIVLTKEYVYINQQSRLRTFEGLFEGFKDVFCGPSAHANFKDRGSRATATTKMELCDQFTLYVGFFETKTIVLVAEARALYGV